MHFETWLSFFALCWGISLSPGPAQLASLSAALNYGWKKCVPQSLGLGLGVLGLVMVVGVGIGAILAASPSLFFIIRLLGCAYLVWLGISLLRAKGHAVIIEGHEAAPERTGWQLFRQGFLVNITNPKELVFFISLLTPFINTDAPILLQYFEMGLTCGFTDFCVMTGVSLAAAAVARRMKGARNVTRMNRVFGTVFVLIGCGLFFFNL